MPTVPVNAAGWRMEPPVSVAVAARQRSAATAAADPPDEPPGTSGATSHSGDTILLSGFVLLGPFKVRFSYRRRHGLTTLPNALVSFDDPIPNSSLLSLPSMIAPASHKFCPTVDSYVG